MDNSKSSDMILQFLLRAIASNRHYIDSGMGKSNHQTYIHNWPLQLFSQDYGLASHTTHVVCVNFTCERWDLQFNDDSERQIFCETFSW